MYKYRIYKDYIGEYKREVISESEIYNSYDEAENEAVAEIIPYTDSYEQACHKAEYWYEIVEIQEGKRMTIEILRSNAKDKSLVVRIREDGTPLDFQGYVVCSHYNYKAKENQQWDWGHYFNSLNSALAYWHTEIMDEPSYDRLSELATLFKDGLIEDDEQSAMEYFEDTCEMTESEMEYFGIIESEEE
jgi:hypothetical protein